MSIGDLDIPRDERAALSSVEFGLQDTGLRRRVWRAARRGFEAAAARPDFSGHAAIRSETARLESVEALFRP